MTSAIWLDQVLAIPVLGIRSVPNFEIGFAWAQSALAIASRRFPLSELTITSSGPLNYKVQVSDGYAVDISHENLVVQFQYPSKAINRAGKLPEIENPGIKPYSELFEKCTELLRDAIEVRTKLAPMQVKQFGIVASCSLDASSLPPGLGDWIGHLGKLWKLGLEKSDTMLMAALAKGSTHLDRCHHTLKFDKGVDKNYVQFMLDWQRVLDEPQSSSTPGKIMSVNFEDCRKSALAYFENIAKGEFGYGEPGN